MPRVNILYFNIFLLVSKILGIGQRIVGEGIGSHEVEQHWRSPLSLMSLSCIMSFAQRDLQNPVKYGTADNIPQTTPVLIWV